MTPQFLVSLVELGPIVVSIDVVSIDIVKYTVIMSNSYISY